MPNYPVTVTYRKDKIDLVVEGPNPGEVLQTARYMAVTLFPLSESGCGLDIQVHVKLPLKEAK